VLVSEYPPGTPHSWDHYRPRNRIISGLSEGIVVVEGDGNSGALITARAALEQSREVFAVPGNVDAPNSVAPNRLIHDREAQAVRNAADILEEFSLRYPLRVMQPPFGEEEKRQRMETVLRTEKVQKPVSGDGKVETEVPVRQVLSFEQQKSLSDDQRDLIRALGEKSRHPDELVEQTQIPMRRVLSALTLLQLQGYINEETGKRFTALVRLE